MGRTTSVLTLCMVTRKYYLQTLKFSRGIVNVTIYGRGLKPHMKNLFELQAHVKFWGDF